MLPSDINKQYDCLKSQFTHLHFCDELDNILLQKRHDDSDYDEDDDSYKKYDDDDNDNFTISNIIFMFICMIIISEIIPMIIITLRNSNVYIKDIG